MGRVSKILTRPMDVFTFDTSSYTSKKHPSSLFVQLSTIKRHLAVLLSSFESFDNRLLSDQQQTNAEKNSELTCSSSSRAEMSLKRKPFL